MAAWPSSGCCSRSGARRPEPPLEVTYSVPARLRRLRAGAVRRERASSGVRSPGDGAHGGASRARCARAGAGTGLREPRTDHPARSTAWCSRRRITGCGLRTCAPRSGASSGSPRHRADDRRARRNIATSTHGPCGERATSRSPEIVGSAPREQCRTIVAREVSRRTRSLRGVSPQRFRRAGDVRASVTPSPRARPLRVRRSARAVARRSHIVP